MTDRELMQQALEALENRDGHLFQDEIQAIDDLRERLAREEQEPVAWMHPDGRIWTFGRGLDKSTFTVPLYTSPPASKPLSVEQIAELDCNDHYKFARAIEAAHGIKENT